MEKGPATKAFAITPADSDLVAPTRGLYVAGGGTLVLTMTDDTSAVTLTSVPAGSYLPGLSVKRVALASTATGIVGFY